MTTPNDLLQRDLDKLFRRFDRNGDGLINRDEFRELLAALGQNPIDEQLATQFAAIDRNNSKAIDLAEFSAWWLDGSA